MHFHKDTLIIISYKFQIKYRIKNFSQYSVGTYNMQMVLACKKIQTLRLDIFKTQWSEKHEGKQPTISC